MVATRVYEKCADKEETKVTLDINAVEKEVLPNLSDNAAFGGPELRSAAFWIGDVEDPPFVSENDPLTSPKNVESLQKDELDAYDDGLRTDSDDDDESTEVESTNSGPTWADLGTFQRVKHVLLQWFGKAIFLLLLLYVFVCSLDFLSSAFRILGGKTAGGVFTNSEIIKNPVAGLMIGILATVLVQSSSTSTSIIVTMVGSEIIEVGPAIPMIMGANIGTSVTNTFVSMAQSGDRKQFRRAFAGATVHDMFNWLTVLVLLPLEVFTGFLFRLTSLIIDSSNIGTYEGGKREFLTALTKPFTSLIVQVDKKVINKIAEGHTEYLNKSLIKKYCVFEKREVIKNVSLVTNFTNAINGDSIIEIEEVPLEKCHSLLSHLDLNETVSGVLLLICALALLCTCLILMVKVLNSILKGSIAKVIKKTLNADFPGHFSWLTGYVAMLAGALMTVLVQSSSVFTSALTPLVGIGMIKLERMYPLTLGSNIGTTGTGLLAAMAATGPQLPIALQIALCHLLFNICGILIYYPIPALRKIPLNCARFLGRVTAKYRWFAIAYLLLMFVLIPGGVFGLSLAGTIPSIIVGSLVCLVVTFVIILNILQSKCNSCLPNSLKTWKFLPKGIRSLVYVDLAVTKVFGVFKNCCPCCKTCCKPKQTKPKTIGDVVKANNITSNIVKDMVKDNKETGVPLKVSPTPSVASSRLLLERLERSSRV
ncbi:sodium-dependent phosphate transport protein 2A-like [Mya arenaria]|uniref:sodium-dependent phosphate transport protein 2A-like n=1 Tax=Mya arenaria TaxID=6604 RepID=UPI0022E3D4BA|nr:sodium-dependent phosphate transport protein 2A-like [Mya arenaria]